MELWTQFPVGWEGERVDMLERVFCDIIVVRCSYCFIRTDPDHGASVLGAGRDPRQLEAEPRTAVQGLGDRPPARERAVKEKTAEAKSSVPW